MDQSFVTTFIVPETPIQLPSLYRDVSPPTPIYRRLTRDQRHAILVLHGLGLNDDLIASHLHITSRSVRYTIENGVATPQHHSAGRPIAAPSTVIEGIITYISSSTETWQLTYPEICTRLNLNINAQILGRRLREQGYYRYAALGKCPLTPQHRAARLS